MHAGDRLNPREETVVEGDSLLRLGVARLRQVDFVGEHVRRTDSEVDVENAHEALGQEPGAEQQNQGDRDLGNHQAAAQPTGTAAVKAKI